MQREAVTKLAEGKARASARAAASLGYQSKAITTGVRGTAALFEYFPKWRLPEFSGNQIVDCEVQILNVQGELVKCVQQIFSSGSSSLVLDMGNQSSGIYFIIITSDEFSLSEKIIKQ